MISPISLIISLLFKLRARKVNWIDQGRPRDGLDEASQGSAGITCALTSGK